MRQRVAYIMSRFPHLPETFILREMIGMEEHGWDIALYPLIFQAKQQVVHSEAIPWLARVHRAGTVSLVGANLRMFFKEPGRVASTVASMVACNASSAGFLLRAILLFPKAVWMAENMRREGIVHIHAHYATHPALVAWVIHRLTGIPYSVTVHAHDIFVNRTMLAEKLQEAAAVVAISEFNRSYLVRHLGPQIGGKIQVIHCGINPSEYCGAAKQSSANGRFEIVSVGSLQPYKGQKDLVAACAVLAQRSVPFRCRIIGGGELEQSLRAQIAELKLEGCVELSGPKNQKEVAAVLAEADCYVQPSIVTSTGKMEGIPVSLMEAMASGIPVVATNISGIPELVRDGDTGWLVPPGSPDSLANALQEALTKREEARQRVQRAQALVSAEFDIEKTVAALSSLIASLVPQEEMQLVGN